MKNKICIVTGAAQGIGRKIVEYFSQAGAAKFTPVILSMAKAKL